MKVAGTCTATGGENVYCEDCTRVEPVVPWRRRCLHTPFWFNVLTEVCFAGHLGAGLLPYPGTAGASAWTAPRLLVKQQRGQPGPGRTALARRPRPRRLRREAACAPTHPRSSRVRRSLRPRRQGPRGHRQLRRISRSSWRTSSRSNCSSDRSASTRSVAGGYAGPSQTWPAAGTGGRSSSAVCGHGGPPQPAPGMPETPNQGIRLLAAALDRSANLL